MAKVKMWAHVTVLLATLLAFGVAMRWVQGVLGLTLPWLVFMSWFCFLGAAKVAEPICTLTVPARLRELRPWEVHGGLYRRFGVPEFGALLRDTPLRFLNTTVYVSRGVRDPFHIRRQVESAEATHFWAAVLLIVYLASCAWSGKWSIFGCFLAVQAMGNAYPIMHLRSVRGRLDRVCRRARGVGP